MTDSVCGLVIPQEILVRSETYVFSGTLVQKDYKKMFTFLYCTVAIEMVLSCDVIIVTGINILMTSENDVLYIIRKKI